MEPVSTEARLLELVRKFCSVNFSSSFLSGTEISLEVLLLRQQKHVVVDAPHVKGTLWMSVWILLFLKKEKSAVSAAVLRRAGSGAILKFLAYCLEKVVLAHHSVHGITEEKKVWVSSLLVYVTPCRGGMTWGAPCWLHSHPARSALQSSVSPHPRLRPALPYREGAHCQQDAFSTTGKGKFW